MKTSKLAMICKKEASLTFLDCVFDQACKLENALDDAVPQVLASSVDDTLALYRQINRLVGKLNKFRDLKIGQAEKVVVRLRAGEWLAYLSGSSRSMSSMSVLMLASEQGSELALFLPLGSFWRGMRHSGETDEACPLWSMIRLIKYSAFHKPLPSPLAIFL